MRAVENAPIAENPSLAVTETRKSRRNPLEWLETDSEIAAPGLIGSPHSDIFARAANSPTMPRRNASTQATNTTPWITVTHSPNWAR